MINNSILISIDGTQKLFRDGLLNDGHWCEREVGKDDKQQYVYVIEANISLKNGLTIPLMTEYLYRDNNQLTNPTGKEDCELAAFERLAKILKKEEATRQSTPEKMHYRERKQEFFWKNNMAYGDNVDLTIHLVGYLESYKEISPKTRDIQKHYSTHSWISSMAFSLTNCHELCNLGARKNQLIEDSINTEKNRGYHYKY